MTRGRADGPRRGSASKREPGIRRASSTPFSYGTTRSASPWTTSVGAAISSTGRHARGPVEAGVVLGAPALGRRRVLEPVGEQRLELVRVLVGPAGAEGQRHRRARELRRRAAGVRLPRPRSSRPGIGRKSGPPVPVQISTSLLDELGMPERQRLRDVAAHREAGDVRAPARERLGRVVGHLLDRVRPGRLRRAAGAAVLDRDARGTAATRPEAGAARTRSRSRGR